MVLMLSAPAQAVSPTPTPAPTPAQGFNFTSDVLPLWDISGQYSNSLGQGITPVFDIVEDTFGKIHGAGTVTINNSDMTVTGTATVSGQVKSSGTVATLVSLTLVVTSGSGTAVVSGSTATSVKFTGTIKLDGEIYKGMNIMITKATAVLKLTDSVTHKRKIVSPKILTGSYPVVLDLPSNSTGGWNLALDNLMFKKNKYTGSVSVDTSTGAAEDLNATGSFLPRTGYSTLTLRGTRGEGGSVSLILSGSDTMTVHSLKGKLFGQTLNYKP